MVLPHAISAFTNTQLKDAKWASGFRRPKPNLEQNVATTPHSLTSNRQFFDPAHNERYIGLHRENLTMLDEALEDVGKSRPSIFDMS